MIALAAVLAAGPVCAQERLYTQAFSLSDVELLDGPFKHAQDLNVKVLLEYDVDRLLAPFLLQAGLEPKGELFPNWEGLDGHVGGHYLSAMAIHYASTGNEECLRRMNYMLDELDKCQKQSERGYVGGVPDSDKIWDEIHGGNTGILGRYWVPWYNVHKIFAGLRDTWLYAGSEKGREMFLKLCDWGCWVTENLTPEQMESMLGTEFGGMNEVYADAYQMTMDRKYLDEAKKWTHHWLFDSMLKGVDNLDNKHANTQVPKVVGFARYYSVSRWPLQGDTWFDRLRREKLGLPSKAQVSDTYDPDYLIASEFFWDRVANHRSVAFGGNSRREHFPQASDYHSYVEEREGPESCNTNNMLKLTEDLFFENPRAEYADFYENALYNHILSTQHPEHGGYVYFTPARPAHYRVYSQPNEGMWCCVGTGMENHGKYGEFIYAHFGSVLYVNLFIASKLNWKEYGVELVQETRFPEEGRTVITVNPKKPVTFSLNLRCPGWVRQGEYKVTVNGQPLEVQAVPQSFVSVSRKWKKGDRVEITMPMHLTIDMIEGVDDYVAIKDGPILMGVRTGTENMDGLVAGDGRWEHIAGGKLVSAFDAPYIIGGKAQVEKQLEVKDKAGSSRYLMDQPEFFSGKFKGARLEPFYKIHDSRYSIYYMMLSPEQYQEHLDELAAKEAARLALDARTVDRVTAGEQQPEVDHLMKAENSSKGNYEGEAWRDAQRGGYFEYTMSTQGHTDLSLMVRYWGNESDFNRRFDILVDGEKIASEVLSRKWNKAEFQNVTYAIPEELLAGKKEVTVRFQSGERTVAGGVFQVRLVRP